MTTRQPDRPLARRRVAGAIVATVLVALAVYAFYSGRWYARQFDAWTRAEPVRFVADLSRAGTVDAPFEQTCQVAHGEAVLLEVPGASEPPAVLLKGLRGRMTVVDSGGAEVLAVDLPDARLLETPAPEGGVELANFWPFPVGTYTLRLHVTEPAPALAGRPQAIVARYRLCGMERMPADVLTAAGVVFAVPAVVVAALTVIGVRRHGWRLPTAAAVSSASPSPVRGAT